MLKSEAEKYFYIIIYQNAIRLQIINIKIVLRHIIYKILLFIASKMVCYNTNIKIGKEKCYENKKGKIP